MKTPSGATRAPFIPACGSRGFRMLLAVVLAFAMIATGSSGAAATGRTSDSAATVATASTPAKSATAAPAAAPAARKTPKSCAKRGMYLARYYRGSRFRGKPVKRRCERRINRRYRSGQKPVNVPVRPNNFSVKWTKIRWFAGGRYDFRAVADNGIRIRVDRRRVAGTRKPGRYVNGVRWLRRGKHRVEFWYFKRRGPGYARAQLVRAPDRRAPHRPRRLRKNVRDSKVTLRWRANNEIDLRGYRVNRNGRFLRFVRGNRFTDRKLDNGERYRYAVRAVDHRGNRSRPRRIAATPRDNVRPARLARPKAKLVKDNSAVRLLWKPSNEADVDRYLVFRREVGVGKLKWHKTVPGKNRRRAWDDSIEPGGTYMYRIAARDTSGNLSKLSKRVGIKVTDGKPPAAPTGLEASAADDQIELSWDANSENDVSGYNVYRAETANVSTDGDPRNAEPLTEPGYTDNTATPGTKYFYVVTAVDDAGNESKSSNETSATVEAPDTTAPEPPTGLTADAADSRVTLDWADNGEDGVDHYTVYRDDEEIATVDNGSTYVDNDVENGTSYTYTVTAVDTADNESDPSEAVEATPKDSTAPAAPTGLTATATDDAVDLSWKANAAGDVAGYNVYRAKTANVPTKGDPLNTEPLAEPEYADETATPGTKYSYVVTAVDDAGNESGPSEPASATIEVVVNEKYSFTASDDDNVPDGYTKNDGSAWTAAAGLGWVEQGSLDGPNAAHTPLDLTANTRVRPTRDGINELQRRLIHLQYGDIEPPGTNGTATAGAFERKLPDGWYEVTVSVGDRAGGSKTGCPEPCYDSLHTVNAEGETPIDGFKAISDQEYATGTVTVHVTDGRLTIDAIGGNNTKINYLEIDSTDAPDTEPPAAPAGLGATAADNSVDLSWDENEETDLAGYRIYRSTSADVPTKSDGIAGLVTTNSYTDTDVLAGTTYHYTVVAEDTSGNRSEASNEASATPEGVAVNEKYSFTTTEDDNVPNGYTKNDGSAWTDADGIGWVTQESLDEPNAQHEPLDLTANTRVRDARQGVGELQRRLIHLQYGDVEPPGTNGTLTAGAFERKVPDGWYEVKVSVGDQEGGSGYDSQHSINVESVSAIEKFQGSAAKEFATATVTVHVTDGRLTVDALGGTNSKLNYLEIDRTTQPDEPVVHEQVRFADESSAPPAGYVKDFGQAYGQRNGADQGAGLTFGWRALATDEPVSLVGNGRNRLASGQAPVGTPELSAGLVHMQLPDNASSGVSTPGYWEMKVPDGAYKVTVMAGDAGPTVDSEHWLNIEGQNAIAAFVPTGGAGALTHHASAIRTVTVDDGRLTITPRGGTNTKVNWVAIDSVAGSSARPSVRTTTPDNLATGVAPDTTSVVADLNLVGGGVDADSLTGDTVTLVDVADGGAVDGEAFTSGGADTIGFAPSSELEPNTLYRLEITSGAQDVAGNAFLPYSMVFETGEDATGGGPVAFDQQDSGAQRGAQYTSVTVGPDGKLYAGSITGEVYRFDIADDGTLSNRQTITTVQDYSNSAASGDTYKQGNRTVIGLAFDPASTADDLTLWISDNAPFLGESDVPDFTGRIAKLTGPDLGNYTAVLEHLPRSVKDHETNSLAFGPDGALYFNQGANNAMGAPDGAWKNREEQLLSAAVLRLDTGNLPANLPLDVGTGEAGDYDPFAPGAPLTIYASGVRNAYDLVWHSNGHLYVPTNGSAAGGNVPEVPDDLPAVCAQRPDGGYSGPKVEGVNNNPAETDYVFDVKQGQYYGHPNPSRCEYVLNNGNPTAGADPFENSDYPVGTQPDPNYALSDVYDAGKHASANGVIEYKGGAFGGAMDGKLLYVRYSSGQDIVTFDVADNGDLSNRTVGRSGLTGFNQPLDLTEHVATGNIYVTELSGNSGIELLTPQGGGGGPVPKTSDRLVFSGATGATSDYLDATISNDGVEDLVVSDVSLAGDNPGQFALTSESYPQTIAAGESIDVPVAFEPGSTGVKSAELVFATNAGTKSVSLRGLAATGLGGSNEPSLQRIMDTLEIPIEVGDPDPSNASMPSKQGMIGDEIPAQLFEKAAFDAPISITPVAAYGPQDDDPAIKVGWYDAGDADGLHEQFTVAADDAQGLMIDPSGDTTDIDPGEDTVFGFYSSWPYFDGQTAYTEDVLNTWDSALPHHVRVYPMKNPDGTIEPDTYVVATEEVAGPGFDTQDIVLIVGNVEPYVPEAADAVLETENLDGLPYDDRLAMSRIQNPADDEQKTHDVATVRVRNTGTEPMQVGDLNINGAFELDDPPSLPLTIGPGDFEDVSVQFTATGGDVNEGSLVLVSNAGENGVATVELAGFWQSQSEGGQEPDVHEIADVFGYGTDIPENLNGNGYVQAVGDEVLSPYWRQADESEPVNVRQIAAYHTYGNGAAFRWTEKNGNEHHVTDFDADYSQSILPPRNGGWPATFDPGPEVFGFAVDGESSDDTRNNQSADEANGCPGPCGHHMRFFPVEDRSGDRVANTYLLTMDYSGINYDYNDNVYLIENIEPEHLITPKGLSALAEDGKVTLTWSPTGEDGVSYRVWRSTAPNVPADSDHLVSGKDALTGSEFVDEDVTNGTTYYYVVRAVRPGESNSTSTEPVAATPNAAGAFAEDINFQSEAAPVPGGYRKDFGQAYGSRSGADQGTGLSYGWIGEEGGQPVNLSVGGSTPGNGRDRDVEDDQRLDTLMHMQGDDVPDFNGTPVAGMWEIAVPDGTYTVTVAVGDPNNNSDPEAHTLNVEGTNAVDGFVPSGAAGAPSHHAIATVEDIVVDDGRLTLDALGGTNTKINYVDIAATN